MARAKYTLEQKKEIVERYLESTGSMERIVISEVIRWANANLNLYPPLGEQDLRRPAEFKEWIGKINDRIDNRIITKNEIKEAVTTGLFDLDTVIAKCTSENALRKELLWANKRYNELVESYDVVLKQLTDTKNERDRLKNEVRRLEDEQAHTEKAYRDTIRKTGEELHETKRTCTKLMAYIRRYISDEVMAYHFSKELMLLVEDPDRPVTLSKEMEELLNADRPVAELITEFDDWMSEYDDEQDERNRALDLFESLIKLDEASDDDTPGVSILSAKQVAALDMLDDLE